MEYTDILTMIIQSIIIPLLILGAREVRKWIDANLNEKQQDLMILMVRTAVLATEQIGLSGAEAKKLAIDMAETELTKQGIIIDANRLGNMIEAALYDEINRFKSLKMVKMNE